MMFSVLLVGALSLAYFYIKWIFTYWERKGFPSAPKNIPFGALNAVRQGKRSLGCALTDVYNETKGPIIGIYLGPRPALLVRDAQLMNDMVVKDFQSFHDRGLYVDEENAPTSAGIFSLTGNKWKTMRGKMSPSFTSGKLKAMFQQSLVIADRMVDRLNTIVPDKGSVEFELKEVTSLFAIDIIASTIFGLDVNSFKDPNNEFMEVIKVINKTTFKDKLRLVTILVLPGLEKLFNRIGWTQQSPQTMFELVKRTIAFREKHNIVRKDILQLMLQLRNTGSVSSDDTWSAGSSASNEKSLSIERISGELFVLFAAGHETTASTIAFSIYEMMRNPKVLAKAQEEVRDTLEKYNGEFSYEAIQDMKYLELCLLESARKYPALPIWNRECTKDYVIPETQQVIKKGTPIVIPILGIHRDDRYFPDAMSFQPERYSEEHREYNRAAFMPFGDGPRICIGARMGKMNVKLAIAKILANFDVITSEKKEDFEYLPYGITLLAKNGIPVRLAKKKLAA